MSKPEKWETMTDAEKNADACQLANSDRGAFILAGARVLLEEMTKEEIRERLSNCAEQLAAHEARSDAEDMEELAERIDAWYPRRALE